MSEPIDGVTLTEKQDPAISVGEALMARMALNNVLRRISDEHMAKSLSEAVANTITGKPVAPVEGESNADTIPNSR